MRRILPENWVPKGVPFLEPNAWSALRREESACVIAGPGAGKTEFLAQKAAYLLETGICSRNRKILAISFKTDAASNLAKRVALRCPPEISRRFESMTFDAFTKSLVDRFHSAIPAHWRPSRPYEILFANRNYHQDFLTTALLGAPIQFQDDIAGISAQDFESRIVGSYRLPIPLPPPAADGTNYAIQAWWQHMLNNGGRSSMTFVGLNRLAELILRHNPQLLQALRATYQFVFVDEFQDTTFAQYDFLLSVFQGSPAVLTSVGDNKQRIMTWAGARTDSFERFAQDFRANSISLTFNFRSSPDLVRIQQFVAQALDPDADQIEAKAPNKIDGDVAQIWTSNSRISESAAIASWITDDMDERGLHLRDYAILVRQKADDYEAELAPAFHQAGLRIRNESRLIEGIAIQDLLSEELCHIVLTILRLGSVPRNPSAWRVATEALQRIRNVDPDDAGPSRKLEKSLTDFLGGLRRAMVDPPTENVADLVCEWVIAFLDPAAIRRSFLQYSLGDMLDRVSDALTVHLRESTIDAASWAESLDRFEGVDQVPLMTVHKSKGLEFDTILFVGMDDSAWWTYSAENPEGLATFFVALSRAKQRAIFSFCSERGRRTRIADLYQLLNNAGVPELEIE